MCVCVNSGKRAKLGKKVSRGLLDNDGAKADNNFWGFFIIEKQNEKASQTQSRRQESANPRSVTAKLSLLFCVCVCFFL